MEHVTIGDLMWRTQQVVEHEREVIHDQLHRNRVSVISGAASFVDPHTLEIQGSAGGRHVWADRVVIAVGTTPARPPGVDFDDRTVLDSDGLGRLTAIPGSLTVVGGGVIGVEYASMAAALGVKVTLVEKRARILDFVDADLVESLQYHLRGLGVALRLGEEVAAVERLAGGGVVTHLASGTRVPSELVLYAAGRQGATAALNLPAAGLEADARGRIAVDAEFRTGQPHIFAAGDVIGFPGLAAASMEQGRRAALAAFGKASAAGTDLLPYGIYTICLLYTSRCV